MHCVMDFLAILTAVAWIFSYWGQSRLPRSGKVKFSTGSWLWSWLLGSALFSPFIDQWLPSMDSLSLYCHSPLLSTSFNKFQMIIFRILKMEEKKIKGNKKKKEYEIHYYCLLSWRQHRETESKIRFISFVIQFRLQCSSSCYDHHPYLISSPNFSSSHLINSTVSDASLIASLIQYGSWIKLRKWLKRIGLVIFTCYFNANTRKLIPKMHS